MRSRRAAIVLALVASFVGLLACGSLAIGSPDEGGFTASQDDPSSPIGTNPAFRAGPAATKPETDSPTEKGSWVWSVGAMGAAVVLIASVVLFRVEVRREKDELRARRQREQYHRDLKKYNAQLKGPPNENN